ncbi:MAG: hypothetical protein J5I53_01295 [Bradyrhizobiaceae bacterium]|nr:hypothetical protein [Bradyrhizobiaceae bacterium]
MLRLLIAGVCCVAFLSSCTSSTTPSNPNDDKTNGNNQFTVDGNGYSNGYWRGYKDEATQIAYTSTASGTGNFVFGGLTTVENETFMLSMLTSKAEVGTFTVDAVQGNAISLVYGDAKKTFIATSGSIVISQYDAIGGRAKGTFSGSFVEAGTAATTITVKNGKFDLPVKAEI